MLERFERIFLVVNRAAVASILAAIFLIVFTNVVLRYGFGWSFSWGEETARYLMVAGAYLGAGLALRENRLVAIDLFVDLLPAALRLFVRYGVAVLMIVFMVALVWVGIRFAMFGANKETMATQISRAIPYSAIPIGAALFVIHSLFFIKRFVARDYDDGSADEEEGGVA